MSFVSKHAHLIWDAIYTVQIPEQLTINQDYVRLFGVRTTGDKQADKALESSFTTVMISPIQMIEYFDKGIEIRITNREDMIKIHKDIELYLDEWAEHLKYDINLRAEDYKDLIASLEGFSKTIYAKAKIKEVINNLFVPKSLGIMNPFEIAKRENSTESKPDYKGIGDLVRERTVTRNSRF